MIKFIINKSNFCSNYSDWIIIWFILYKFKIVHYTPKISIIVGIFINLYFVFSQIINKEINFERNNVLFYSHIIIKFIMFYLLLDIPYTKPDIIMNIIIFILFNIWLYVLHKKFLFNHIIHKKINLENINKNYKIKLDDVHKNYKIKLDKYNKINNDNKNINNIDDKIFKNKLEKINIKYGNKLDKLFIKYNMCSK